MVRVLYTKQIPCEWFGGSYKSTGKNRVCRTTYSFWLSLIMVVFSLVVAIYVLCRFHRQTAFNYTRIYYIPPKPSESIYNLLCHWCIGDGDEEKCRLFCGPFLGAGMRRTSNTFYLPQKCSVPFWTHSMKWAKRQMGFIEDIAAFLVRFAYIVHRGYIDTHTYIYIYCSISNWSREAEQHEHWDALRSSHSTHTHTYTLTHLHTYMKEKIEQKTWMVDAIKFTCVYILYSLTFMPDLYMGSSSLYEAVRSEKI